MFPTITSGNTTEDIDPFSVDYKSDGNIDSNMPMSSLDTDYRPNYDGKLI